VEALGSIARKRGRLIDRVGGFRTLAIVGILLAALVVSRSCQRSQIRVTKDQAIARAEAQVRFDPTNEQVRLLRQGLASRPFWIVSLSIPRRNGTFADLAVVRVDANTGKVEDVRVQRPGSAR
jgi:hypothetical protein